MAIAERWKGHPPLPDGLEERLPAVVARGRCLHAESADLENQVELKFLREYQDMEPFRRVQRAYLRSRHGLDGP